MTSDFTIGDATRYKAIIEGNTIKIKELELFLEDWRTMKKKAEKWDQLPEIRKDGVVDYLTLAMKLENIKNAFQIHYSTLHDCAWMDRKKMLKALDETAEEVKKLLADQTSGGTQA